MGTPQTREDTRKMAHFPSHKRSMAANASLEDSSDAKTPLIIVEGSPLDKVLKMSGKRHSKNSSAANSDNEFSSHGPTADLGQP